MKTVKRLYSFSDAILYQMAIDILDSAKRDLADLADQGVTQEKLDAIGLINEKFMNHGSDRQLMYGLKYATRLRDEAGKLLLQYINQVISKAIFGFGADDSRVTAYGVGDISHDTPMDKYLKACTVLTVAKVQQPQLLEEGMSDALLLKLKNQIELFHTLILAQREAKLTRKVKMQERTELGNEPYTAIKILAGKGKLCWMYSDSARHNNYILYHTHARGTQTIESKIEAESVVSHELAGVKPSTSITIKNKGLTEIQAFFAGDPLDIAGEPHMKILSGAEKIITASSLGYNKAAKKTCFNVFNIGDAVGSYEVVWK